MPEPGRFFFADGLRGGGVSTAPLGAGIAVALVAVGATTGKRRRGRSEARGAVNRSRAGTGPALPSHGIGDGRSGSAWLGSTSHLDGRERLVVHGPDPALLSEPQVADIFRLLPDESRPVGVGRDLIETRDDLVHVDRVV